MCHIVNGAIHISVENREYGNHKNILWFDCCFQFITQQCNDNKGAEYSKDSTGSTSRNGNRICRIIIHVIQRRNETCTETA